MPKKNAIPDEVWETYVASFELGFMGVTAIARRLGLSPQTVSREMKRRGAVKCSRMHEVVEEIEARLDRDKQERELMKLAEAERRQAAIEANCKVIGRLVALLEAADDRGELALLGPAMKRMAKGSAKSSRPARR
ncbi:hypothetical protein EH30_14515 [Erythrobacter sp. JL475]|nr:hypothetical protein EH30_14515 [Erythrobacter sp. JL475]